VSGSEIESIIVSCGWFNGNVVFVFEATMVIPNAKVGKKGIVPLHEQANIWPLKDGFSDVDVRVEVDFCGCFFLPL